SLARTVLGIPVVLFRDAGGTAHALLDRCPHRNVPLSAGRVCGDEIECAYHGWRFAGDGRCTAIPGLPAPGPERARRALALPAVEQQGLVWTWPSTEAAVGAPLSFPSVGERGFTTVLRILEADANMFSILENTLDVPHTAFLHRGLFRGGGTTSRFEAVLRVLPHGVEAEYLGEKAPSGLLGRLLAHGDGTLRHVDRFLLPCVAQVEYGLGPYRVFISTAHTPVSDTHTRVYAVVTFKLPLPGWLARPFITPIANRVWAQDARVLRLQSSTTRTFGGEQYVHTPLDVMGGAILRMLKEVERGESPTTQPEQRVSFEL
ncbi:MAG: Rieske 2Fe-2S domain-containing protein, partial [Deltaproteobacteria bacterium]|nr:Rieske 2Fe-2S domain-containing protein [Deltaproteobacteria bacterium]